MFLQKRIAAVIPCFNEARQVPEVLRTMPDYVDHMVVVDDGSTDDTAATVSEMMEQDPRIQLVRHEGNQGVGAAIATGYKWCAARDVDVAVVMAGDGQMSPEDLPAVIEPVARGEVDYAKGNRLLTHKSYKRMPFWRFVGNAVLSLLTKIASGYWHVSDSQSGYAALGRLPLRTIDWDLMYKRYGQPNDLLVRLNVYDFRVRDIPMEPVYGVGEQSAMKKRKVVFTLSWLLVQLFLWRIKEKYIVRDFHPLVFFLMLGTFCMVLCAGLTVRLVVRWWTMGVVPEVTLLALGIFFITGLQTLFFAMLFDMQHNRGLR